MALYANEEGPSLREINKGKGKGKGKGKRETVKVVEDKAEEAEMETGGEEPEIDTGEDAEIDKE